MVTTLIMSNKTAVTSKSEYQTRACQICGTEVALGDVPQSSVDEPGHLVVIAPGELSIEEENNGNWDIKSEFSLTREDNENPNVKANVICESCAQEVHDVSGNTEALLSSIPEELKNSKEDIPESVKQVIIALMLGVVILFVIAAVV